MNHTSKLPLTLLPKVPGLRLEDTFIDADTVSLTLASTSLPVACPVCGHATARLHSHYRRTVADLPWSGRRVRLLLSVRKFRCPRIGCPRRIFTERLPSLVEPYARKTARLHEVLKLVGFALRGRRYGTIIVDLERHRPIELLPDRSAGTLSAWLKEHPAVRIIGRDRSTEYERGIEEGAPTAVEVLDRWHLLKNLREAAERVLEHNHEVLSTVRLSSVGNRDPCCSIYEHTPVPRSAKERAVGESERRKRLADYKKVKKLHEQGMNMLAICRYLGMSRGAVRRYVHADAFPERSQRPPEPSMLDPFGLYLAKRWQEGCRNALQMWREIREQGYPGAQGRVLQWARQRREEPAPTTPGRYRSPMMERCQKRTLLQSSDGRTNHAPSPKRLVWLLLEDPENLGVDERRALEQVLKVSNDAAVIYPLIRRFRKMVRHREGEAFGGWLKNALSCGVKDFETFAIGFEREQSAVEVALTLPYSNGQTEGQINRLKLIKRSMYGRASFDLLRQRELGAA